MELTEPTEEQESRGKGKAEQLLPNRLILGALPPKDYFARLRKTQPCELPPPVPQPSPAGVAFSRTEEQQATSTVHTSFREQFEEQFRTCSRFQDGGLAEFKQLVRRCNIRKS